MAKDTIGIYNHETGLNETREMTDAEQAELLALRQSMPVIDTSNFQPIVTGDE
jgi:hypothetical protein